MHRTHRRSLPLGALGLLLLPALALAQDSQPAKPKGGGAGEPPAKAKSEAQKLHDAVVKALSEGAIKLECKLQATMTRADGESESQAASAAFQKEE